jgi:hypothetical protein
MPYVCYLVILNGVVVSGVKVFVNAYAAGGLWGVYVSGETDTAVHTLTNTVQAIKQAGSNSTAIENAKTEVNCYPHKLICQLMLCFKNI